MSRRYASPRGYRAEVDFGGVRQLEVVVLHHASFGVDLVEAEQVVHLYFEHPLDGLLAEPEVGVCGENDSVGLFSQDVSDEDPQFDSILQHASSTGRVECGAGPRDRLAT